jgi:hypothetical protein
MKPGFLLNGKQQESARAYRKRWLFSLQPEDPGEESDQLTAHSMFGGTEAFQALSFSKANSAVSQPQPASAVGHSII